ncbi:MAG: transcription elongation factor GreA [Bacteroidetes bacterium]|nr:transcription elongation factor GreA [Bacteroidota bacterium]
MVISRKMRSTTQPRIEARDLPNDKIYILSRVKLKDLKTGELCEYLLVSPEESNFEENKISVSSPIGKGLLGRKTGDTVEVKVPVGVFKYEILEVTR